MAQAHYYDHVYRHLADDVLTQVLREAHGEYFGQNSFLTAEQYRAWLPLLNVQPHQHVLDMACGAGGPAVFLASMIECRLTGVDVNEHALLAAQRTAETAGLHTRVQFQYADANQRLPFEDATFDGLVCIDAIPHFADRAHIVQEWHRVLRPGARLLYTDTTIVTGPISNAEIAARSSIGFTLFVPPGENERLLAQTGFQLVHCADVTESLAQYQERHLRARERHRAQLLQLEGPERYEDNQARVTVAHRLAHERRLSRMVYIAEKARNQ